MVCKGNIINYSSVSSCVWSHEILQYMALKNYIAGIPLVSPVCAWSQCYYSWLNHCNSWKWNNISRSHLSYKRWHLFSETILYIVNEWGKFKKTYINSLRQSVVYMYTNEPKLAYCQLDPKGPTSVKFESKYTIFILKHEFENVICKMSVICLSPIVLVIVVSACAIQQGLHPANERRRYFVTTSLIGWAKAWNQPYSNIGYYDSCRHSDTGIILYVLPANKRWCYIVTWSLIGWVHTQNDLSW